MGKMVKYDVQGIANTVIACKYKFNDSMVSSVSTETDKKVLIDRCGPVLHILRVVLHDIASSVPKMLEPHPDSMALSKC